METFKKIFLLFFLMSISSGYAIDYCATPRSSASPNTSYTLNYTCRNVSGTTYEMKLEFANTTGGNANANIASNPGGVNVAASPVWSNANKTLTYTFTSPSNPTLFVATVFVIISGTEVRWDLPINANFAATCGGGGGNPLPTFGEFTIPAKTVGDADFTISQPTTNSSGAITYSSGNTGVATIVSGNMLHIVGGGTSTITLNQAADATHSAGSTTATLTVVPAITTPTNGPTTPPARNSWDVLSQYGSAYTNQAGVAFFDFGGSTIVGDVTLTGDNSVVKKYTNHNYSGISANGAQNLNVSAMTHMHIDVWSPDFTSFKIKLEAVNGSNVELEVPGAKSQGVWNSYEIPLSTYSAVNLSQLRYIVPVSPGARTLFITNVYFYRPATTQPPTLGTFTVPAANIGAADFALTPPTSNSAGAWSYSSDNTSVATIVGGNMIHIVGGGTSTITATQAANGVYGIGTATASFVVNVPPPPAAPTQPARDPGDVISIFASAYSDMAGTDFNPGWGQSTNYPNNMTTPSYGGDQVKRYLNSSNYQGTRLGADINVSQINNLHIDIYSPALTSIQLFLIKTTGGTFETSVTIPLTPGTWTSANIAVNATTFPGLDLTQVREIKYLFTAGQAFAIDNFYFYRETATVPTLGEFTVPAKVLGDADFTITVPSSNSAGAFTYSSSNTAVATIVGGNSIHIVGAGTSTITATQAANGIYAPASTTAPLVVTVPPLATAAPTPPARNAWDVISLYSNAYTPHSELSWQNQSSLTDEQLEGNDTKKMANFGIEIFTFTPANLTAMTTLHMDVYSEDCNAMNIWLLNNGDRRAQIALTPNQWNSIDIPMSTYIAAGLNLNGVFFLKFESLNGGGKTVYVDNIYFFRPTTSLPPTITNFNVPAQAFGAPDFTITAPTSDSAGAFTYTSSNTNVATIVNGNMIHVVGGGTSTITANQAADGSYGAGSITAQLAVAFPAPSASPAPPARTADRVISLYTGTPSTYTNAITAASAPWSGATMTEIPNGTNTALQLDNFGYLGLTDQAEARFDASGMSHLHLDIYLNEPLSSNPGLSRVNVFLLANGDYLYPVSNLTAGWNSVSIPMSNFSAADLTVTWGLKLESINPATQIYLDNVYFSNECYTYYADADNDGYGNPTVSQIACDGTPAGYVLDNTDCNDAVTAIHPNAVEVPYNGVDDDCDGAIDETGTVTTTLLSTSCGVTLSSIQSLVGIVTVAGHNITGYRIRITNGSEVQVIEKGVPNFTFPQFPSYAYATTYKVEIQLQRAGVWQASWGTPCFVSTPAILEEGGAAAVSPSQCGLTLPKINTLIATTSIAGVTGYRFRVTNLTDVSGPNAVQVIDRALNWFSLQMLTRYNFGTMYRIEVAVKTTGTYGGFGAPCEVSSPAAPSLINCGGTVAGVTTAVGATSVQGATQYRFQITRDSDGASTTIDRGVNWFSFNSVLGAAFSPGVNYNIRVAVMTTGTWSPFGDICQITSPGIAAKGMVTGDTRTAETTSFKTSVYPNPFTADFNIDVTTSSQEKVQVKVYNMLGVLVEAKEMEASDVNTMKVGSQYPSGVYNVIVSQNGVVKTLRVIKR